MPRPTLPVTGSASWDVTLNAAINNVSDRADAAVAVGTPGAVAMDSFTGSTDDAKLTAALSYAAAQTRIPAIAFPARLVTLSTSGRTPFSGMKLYGPAGAGPKNLELSSGKLVSHKVQLNVGLGTSAWFNGGSSTFYDIYIGDLAFQAGSNAQFWHQPGGTLYACQFHSLTHFGFSSIFGAPTAKALLTQVYFTGIWQAIGSTGTQFYVGGSDCMFWMGGYINIGGSATAGAGKYLFQFDFMGKTDVGYIYATCNNGWRGVHVTSNGPKINFYGGSYEGLNSSNPCDGTLIKVDGGGVAFYGPWLAYAMNAPGGTEHGVIEVTGGNVLIDRPTYARGTAANTVPMVYQSGGKVEVRSAYGQSGDTPQVHAAAGSLVADASVAVV